MSQTVSDLLLERLLDWGVDTIFGLPGDGINGFMESLRTHRDRVRFVHTRHEETAALAAVGYAKFHRMNGKNVFGAAGSPNAPQRPKITRLLASENEPSTPAPRSAAGQSVQAAPAGGDARG